MTSIYRTEAGARAIQSEYARLLDQWPVPHERLIVPTTQGNTFVVACGPEAGPPLILLQGSGANAALWIRDVATWARHFRVYAIDMIGEPGFSAPSRPPLSPAAYSVWLDEVLSGLHLVHVAITGVSLGGWVALSFATRHAERVARLVLLCPAGIGRQRVWPLLKLLPLLFLGRWGRRRAMEVVAGQRAGRGYGSEQGLAAMLTLIARDFRPRRGKVPLFEDSDLRKLTMPVLLVIGGRDVLLNSEESARRVRDVVTSPTIRLLPDLGHVIWGQAEPILEFLLHRPDGQRAAV